MYNKYMITTSNDTYNKVISFMTSCGYIVVATDVLCLPTNHSTIFNDVMSSNVIYISDGGLGKGNGLCVSVFGSYDATKDFMHQPKCLSTDNAAGQFLMLTDTGILHCNYNNGTCMFSVQNKSYAGNTSSIVFGNARFLTNSAIDGDMFIGILYDSKYIMYLRAKTDDRGFEWLCTDSEKAKLIMSWPVETVVPHYHGLFTIDTPEKSIKLTRNALGSTLNCSTLIMPTIFYCKRIPLSSETVSAIAVSDIIGVVDMFNMSSGHLKQQDFPEKSSYRCYNNGARRSGIGYFGVSFKQ